MRPAVWLLVMRIGLDELQLFLKIGAEEVLRRSQILAALLGFPTGLDLVGSCGQRVDADAAGVVDGIDDRHVVGALEDLGAAAGAMRPVRTRSLHEDEIEIIRNHIDGAERRSRPCCRACPEHRNLR